MCEYEKIKYTNEDIERIIANKERRLEDLENWSTFTRYMECGEIKELIQSCVDDKIIISCLKKILNDNWTLLDEKEPDESGNYNVIIYDEDLDEYEVNTLYYDSEEGLWFDPFGQGLEIWPVSWKYLPAIAK
jgi:hypothetical protein